MKKTFFLLVVSLFSAQQIYASDCIERYHKKYNRSSNLSNIGGGAAGGGIGVSLVIMSAGALTAGQAILAVGVAGGVTGLIASKTVDKSAEQIALYEGINELPRQTFSGKFQKQVLSTFIYYAQKFAPEVSYEEISNEYKRYIAEGHFCQGQIPTLRRLAKNIFKK